MATALFWRPNHVFPAPDDAENVAPPLVCCQPHYRLVVARECEPAQTLSGGHW